MKEALTKKPAKLCYEHLGGKLGELLLEQLLEKGWLARKDDDKALYITDKGVVEFTKFGINLAMIKG